MNLKLRFLSFLITINFRLDRNLILSSNTINIGNFGQFEFKHLKSNLNRNTIYLWQMHLKISINKLFNFHIGISKAREISDFQYTFKWFRSKHQRRVRGKIKKHVFSKFGYSCYICKRRVIWSKSLKHRLYVSEKENHYLTIDHNIPKSRGGNNKVENLITMCNYCNELKDDLTLDEFLQKINEGSIIIKYAI